MAKFLTLKQKLNNIWNKCHQAKNEILDKTNEFRCFFNNRGKTKNDKLVYDSDWIDTVPYSIDRNVTPDQALSETFSINERVNLDIPEHFLPFLDVQIQTKTMPEVSAKAFLEYTTEGWESDYIEAYGNGISLIYKGRPLPYYWVYSADKLGIDFLENKSLQVWNSEIYYTKDGSEWRVDGRLKSLFLHEDLNIACDPIALPVVKNYNEYESFRIKHLEEDDIEIICTTTEHRYYDTEHIQNYTSSGISDFSLALRGSGINSIIYVKVNGVEVSYTFPGPYIGNITGGTSSGDSISIKYTYCRHAEETKENKENKELKFSEMKYYQFYFEQSTPYKSLLLYKKVDGVWIFWGGADNDIDSRYEEITDKNFSFEGYAVYYTPNCKFLFGTKDSLDDEDDLIPDGTFYKIELDNLPTNSSEDDDNLFWNYILFKRNPEDRPNKTSSLRYKDGYTTQTILKKDTNKYQLRLKSLIILKALASVNSQTNEYPEYSDTYIKEPDDGNPATNESYIISSEVHSLKTRKYYETAKEDTQYRIQIYLNNPFYWKENRKYKT